VPAQVAGERTTCVHPIKVAACCRLRSIRSAEFVFVICSPLSVATSLDVEVQSPPPSGRGAALACLRGSPPRARLRAADRTTAGEIDFANAFDRNGPPASLESLDVARAPFVHPDDAEQALAASEIGIGSPRAFGRPARHEPTRTRHRVARGARSGRLPDGRRIGVPETTMVLARRDSRPGMRRHSSVGRPRAHQAPEECGVLRAIVEVDVVADRERPD